MPNEWKHLSNWHIDAAKSKQFYIPERDKRTAFSMIPKEYVEFIQEIYEGQKPFYELLKKIKKESN